MKHRHAKIWVALVFAVALATGARESAAVNLLTNPGFDDANGSYNGWFTFGPNVVLSLPTPGDNIIRSGLAAAKIYGAFTLCPGPGSFNVSGCGQAFTPVVGTEYEFSGYSFVSSDDPIPGTNTCDSNRLVAKIVYFNQAVGGVEIASNEVVLGDHNTPVNEWVQFQISLPTPVGAMRVEALLLYLQPACDGGAVYVDDLSFTALTPGAPATNVLANPSFTGNLTGWEIFGNVWYDARSWARRTPSGAAKMYSTFNPAFNSGMYQEFPAAPGSPWELDVHAMTTCMETPILGTNTNSVLARIVFLDAAKLTELGSSEAVILDNSAPLGTWTKHAVTASSAPAGTAFVRAYILFISPASEGGAVWIDDVYFGGLVPTGIGDTPAPIAFQLQPNVPNPFGQSTRIDFELSRSDNVDVSVYDVAGRKVASLVSGRRESGTYSATWNGRSTNGVSAPSGVYWCVLKTSMGQTARRMVLLR